MMAVEGNIQANVGPEQCRNLRYSWYRATMPINGVDGFISLLKRDSEVANNFSESYYFVLYTIYTVLFLQGYGSEVYSLLTLPLETSVRVCVSVCRCNTDTREGNVECSPERRFKYKLSDDNKS